MTYKIKMLIIILISNYTVSCSKYSPNEQKLKNMENMVGIDNFRNPDLYDRYYSVENGVATGIYIRSDRKNGTLRIVKKNDLPVVMDGGCSVINVEFELKSERVLSAFCNGDG